MLRKKIEIRLQSGYTLHFLEGKHPMRWSRHSAFPLHRGRRAHTYASSDFDFLSSTGKSTWNRAPIDSTGSKFVRNENEGINGMWDFVGYSGEKDIREINRLSSSGYRRLDFPVDETRKSRERRVLLTKNDYVDGADHSQMSDGDLVVKVILLVVGLLRLIRLDLGGLRVLGNCFEPSLLAPVQQFDNDVAHSADNQYRQQYIQLHTGAEMRAIRIGDHETSALP